jgi:hypothetical protein
MGIAGKHASSVHACINARGKFRHEDGRFNSARVSQCDLFAVRNDDKRRDAQQHGAPAKRFSLLRSPSAFPFFFSPIFKRGVANQPITLERRCRSRDETSRALLKH